MKILVTGGCGFIGSHFVEMLLESDAKHEVINLDSLTYAAHPDTVEYLEGLSPDRYQFVRMDIGAPEVTDLLKREKVDAVVNFAAESHVDRSILDPVSFVRTNVMGVQQLLQSARAAGNVRFVHVSTDEVYGTLAADEDPFTEHTPMSPNSPYAASKAAADLLVLASGKTYKQPVVITRCSNNFGPFQFPEKLLPLVIANAMEDKTIPVYGDGKQVRDWIYVKDHCSAIEAVLMRGKEGEAYNVGSDQELTNLSIIGKVLDILGKPTSLMKHVGDRPAHDRRYAMNAEKINKELGWSPKYSFEDALGETIEWYQNNQSWWRKVRDENYYEYYEANYKKKFGSVDKKESVA